MKERTNVIVTRIASAILVLFTIVLMIIFFIKENEVDQKNKFCLLMIAKQVCKEKGYSEGRLEIWAGGYAIECLSNSERKLQGDLFKFTDQELNKCREISKLK